MFYESNSILQGVPQFPVLRTSVEHTAPVKYLLNGNFEALSCFSGLRFINLQHLKCRNEFIQMTTGIWIVYIKFLNLSVAGIMKIT